MLKVYEIVSGRLRFECNSLIQAQAYMTALRRKGIRSFCMGQRP